MKSKVLDDDGVRMIALIFDRDDEVMEQLAIFARENALTASHFTGIGAFAGATLGFFDWSSKQYERIEIAEQVEVLSLVGDITVEQGEPKVHAHVVLGKRDGSAHGGHLIGARVRPTLEVMLTESPRHLYRRFDPVSGLALISLPEEPPH